MTQSGHIIPGWLSPRDSAARFVKRWAAPLFGILAVVGGCYGLSTLGKGAVSPHAAGLLYVSALIIMMVGVGFAVVAVHAMSESKIGPNGEQSPRPRLWHTRASRYFRGVALVFLLTGLAVASFVRADAYEQPPKPAISAEAR